MTVKKGWGYWKYKGEEEERNGDFNKAVELYSLAIYLILIPRLIY